ncbi:MAG: FAD/NAD(P)-binding protein [Sulfurifustaceae bacterium]
MPTDGLERQIPSTDDAITVAVIGGAFSGICLAAHLYRAATRPINVLLYERSGAGKSMAFGTREPVHLLNGPVSRHSAFDMAPNDFADFLLADPEAQSFIDRTQPIDEQFVPRMLYWRYLQRLVGEIKRPSPAGASVTFIDAEVRDIVRHPDSLAIVTDDGTATAADFAVLAVGNPPPRSLAVLVPPPYLIDDPWDAESVRAIPCDADITIVGSGQTAIDLVLGIAANGHRGRITLLSRRGCIALPYVAVETPYVADPNELPRRLRPLVRWMRTEASRFGNWRAVVNSLRPHTQRIWYGFSLAEKRRFLEHLAPFWYMHRSRLPPATVQRLAALRASGQMQVIAGRITAVTPRDDGIVMLVRRRGEDQTFALPARTVINCTGPRWDLDKPQNPLIARLIARGIIRWDDIGDGIAVTPDSVPLDASARAAERLFALGPVCRGSLLEIVVARDIRTQCAKVAARLLSAEKVSTMQT